MSTTKNRLLKIQIKRHLSNFEQEQLDLAIAVLEQIDASAASNNKAREVCEPVFVGLRSLLNSGSLLSAELRSHKSRDGHDILDGQFAFDVQTGQEAQTTFAALTYGILIADAVTPPPVMVVPQMSGQNRFQACSWVRFVQWTGW